MRLVITILAVVFASTVIGPATAQEPTVDNVARGKAEEAKSTADNAAGGLKALINRVTVLENATDNDSLAALSCISGEIPKFNGTSWACATLIGNLPYTDVRDFGALGDAHTDDTAAIQAAIAATTHGDVLFFPKGNYVISSQLLITKRISVVGVGHGSQIFQSADDSMFVFDKACPICARPSGLVIRDMYLGSAATSPGTALIRFVNGSNNLVENVTMLGSYYGIHLQGSLINNFVSLRSGVNFGVFFANGPSGGGIFPTTLVSTNQYWVYGEPHNNISPNVNTFIAPALEGGTNGIFNEGLPGEGSVFIFGGTIEGVAGVGVYLKNQGLPSIISGTHFESNGVSDITLDKAVKVSITSVFSNQSIDLINGSRNTVIETSSTDIINIDASARRTIVRATEVNISGNGGLTNNASDTIMVAVSSVNAFDWFGTIGIGTTNPNSNPEGLTANLKLDVEGDIEANSFWTGDIKFHKDGKLVWRMFEDETGLYLEEMATGEITKMPMEKDITGLIKLVSAQREMLTKLQAELSNLRKEVDSLK